MIWRSRSLAARIIIGQDIAASRTRLAAREARPCQSPEPLPAFRQKEISHVQAL
jgi:hypothetical protein